MYMYTFRSAGSAWRAWCGLKRSTFRLLSVHCKTSLMEIEVFVAWTDPSDLLIYTSLNVHYPKTFGSQAVHMLTLALVQYSVIKFMSGKIKYACNKRPLFWIGQVFYFYEWIPKIYSMVLTLLRAGSLTEFKWSTKISCLIGPFSVQYDIIIFAQRAIKSSLSQEVVSLEMY